MENLKKFKKLTERFSVLYVEDDDALVKATTPIFRRLFKHVDTALNGKDGLEKYKNFNYETGSHYDIVISDILMPIINGLELSRSILKINPEQKIIITSAYNDKEYLIELINIGVSGFFEKPIENVNMFKVLNDVCMSILGHNKIEIAKNTIFDLNNKTLFDNNIAIDITKQEQNLLSLLSRNLNHFFSPVDIFNHVYYEQVEKEFSPDSIKGIIKRLRKKLPEDTIINMPNLGYGIKPL
jgi:DNA-binding response OmpR family regulator